MGRFKIQPYNAHVPRSVLSLRRTPFKVLAKPSPSTFSPLTSHSVVTHTSAVSEGRKAARLRRSLQRLISLLAGLSWTATLLGRFTVTLRDSEEEGKWSLADELRVAIGCIAVLQSGLLICYWRAYAAYREAMRRALHPALKPELSLRNSPLLLLICLSECLLHLISCIPALQGSDHSYLFGTKVSCTIEEICYFVLIVRNYHSISLLYWFSAFSTLRTSLFSELAGTTSTNIFVLRSCLARYKATLICAICAFLALTLGLVEDLLEWEGGDGTGSGLWLAASAYVSLGYGEQPPVTSLGRAVIVVSVLFGCVSFGVFQAICRNASVFRMRESQFSSEMRYRMARQLYLMQTVVLIQRWWRLTALRKRKSPKSASFYSYFAQLQAYRQISISCQSAKSTSFPQQIAQLPNSLHPHFHALQKSLFPVLPAKALLVQVSVQASAIQKTCESLARATGSSLHFCMSSRAESTDVMVGSGQGTGVRMTQVETIARVEQ